MEVKLLLGRPTVNLRIWWLRVRPAPGAPESAMKSPTSEEKLILLLLTRLERISVDSYWAHRASGVRGALIKMLEQIEMGGATDPVSLKNNILIGFQILKEAAKARSQNQFWSMRN